eukprot:TRINITY_DN3317_c0_g1_i8.p1 TRINITY_DN3317_c0_g1~~TRINITY_DN3317_c0_g1_i8.p1  ORF type:complete len:849 (+),score=217.91 TRINITY_DN3317_c0_g1_i8:1129-3675(+)
MGCPASKVMTGFAAAGEVEPPEAKDAASVPKLQISAAEGHGCDAVRSWRAEGLLTPRELVGLKLLSPDDQRAKLQDTIARFEGSTTDEGGKSLLHKACQSGDAAAVMALLALGGGEGQTDRDDNGLLPADLAILACHKQAAAVAGRKLPLSDLCPLARLLLPLLLPPASTSPRYGEPLPPKSSLDAGLRAAAATGRVAAVQLLLEHGAEADAAAADGATALLLAAKPGFADVAAVLLAAGATATSAAKSGRTPLHAAAEAGNAGFVKLLLEHSADTEAVTKTSCSTPLVLAARGGHEGCMRVLLQGRASPDAPIPGGWSPLHAASQNGHHCAADLLLDFGAAAKTTTSSGWTPLHSAAQRGDVVLAGLLLDRGASADAVHEDGATCLHLAAQHGFVEMTKRLLESGANAQLKMQGGATALHTAVQSGSYDVIRELLAGRADPNQLMAEDGASGCSPLHLAAQQGAQEITTLLLDGGANATVCMRGGFTALALAARAGRERCCEVLLEHPSARKSETLDLGTSAGWTPLLLACKAGHVGVVRQLLASGASPGLRSKRGRTALMVAVEAKSLDMAEALLGGGAAPNEVMEGGWNALHMACHAGLGARAVDLFLGFTQGHGALLDQATEEGWTPLHLAAQSGDESAVDALLRSGPELPPPQSEEAQQTPLHLAARGGHAGVVRSLLERRAVPADAAAQHGITALHIAAGVSAADTESSEQQVESAAAVAEALLDQGAQVDVQMDGGVTPLMVACRVGREPLVRLLLERGAEAARKSTGGWCSLLLAARNGHARIAQHLVTASPELLEAKTPAGRSALQCAQKYDHSETVQVLQQAQAALLAAAAAGVGSLD